MASSDQFQRLMRLFGEACELPSGERDAFVRAQCGDDPVLAEKLTAMLRADEHPVATVGGGARLLAERIRASDDAAASASRAPGEQQMPQAAHGSHGRISRDAVPILANEYRMIRFLGEGGMGTVYEAEQILPKRRVAIKVIRSSFASRRLLRRFAHEAHILGRLAHPGIAQIYEAGAGDPDCSDQAFLVMEYVDGLTLTAHAAAANLDHRQRLELLAKVGDAVAHAHQRGVIHRDLKPANILVDAQGQPKVLDFGVARVTDGDPEMATQLTSIGQLVGTLPYMSPEQVGGDPSEVDVRSDVYALGVLLYELLAGRLPIDLARRSIPESARLVRESEPVRLGSIRRELRGDIETIVHKALEKEKERRYQSVRELVDDLRRSLAGEPILARQGSAVYLIRKRLRRYQGAVSAVALLAIAAAAFSISAHRQAFVNEQLAIAADGARSEAESQASRAAEAARRLEAELSVSRIERGRLFARTHNLGAAEQLIWPEFLRSPRSPLPFHALCELYSLEPSTATCVTHADDVRVLATSPDGSILVSGDETGEVVAQRIADGETLARCSGLGGAIASMIRHPSGDFIVGLATGEIVRLDGVTLEPGLRLKLSGRRIAALTATPDRRVHVGADDGVLRTLGGEGVVERELRFDGAIVSLDATADGGIVAVGTGVGRIHLLAPDGATVRTIDAHAGPVSSMRFTPDGTRLASGGIDRVLRLWRVADGSLTASQRRPNGTVRGIEISSDGQLLFTVGWWNLDLWNLEDLSVNRSISMDSSPNTLALGEGDHTVATAHIDGVIRFWSLDPDGPRTHLPTAQGPASLATSPDGAVLACGDEAGRLVLLDPESGQALRTLQESGGRLVALAFSPDGSLLATSGRDGVLRLWRVADGSMVAEMRGVGAATTAALSWHPSGATLVVCATDRSFKVVSVPSMEVLMRHPSGGEALAVAFLPDGASFLSAGREQPVRHVALDGTVLGEFHSSTTCWTMAITPDGRRVIIGSWDKIVHIYALEDHSPIAQLEGHSGLIISVAIDPRDSRRLASASADGEVRLWDLEEYRCLQSIVAADGAEALTVAWGAESERLFISDALGRLVAWDLVRGARSIAGNLLFQMSRIKGPSNGIGSGTGSGTEEGTDAARMEHDPERIALTRWAEAILRGERVPALWARPNELQRSDLAADRTDR